MRGGKRPGAGRKPGFAALEAEKARGLIAQRLATELAPIVEKAIKQAKAGDKHARAWLLERAYGRPKESVEMAVEEKFAVFSEEQKKRIVERMFARHRSLDASA